ncbi:MAG: vanadium-dependent haloperoxidase [Pseudomonadota bacterium]
MTQSIDDQSGTGAPTRRGLMKTGAGMAAVAASAGSALTSAQAQGFGQAQGHPIFGGDPSARRAETVAVRVRAAEHELRRGLPRQMTNGDESFEDYRASFHKCLPHNQFGEVDRRAYRKLLRALETGREQQFAGIPLDRSADRKLANPQGAYKFDMTGRDGYNTFMRPAPTFTGLETAAEMGELYWKALCRDVPFSRYGTNRRIAAAAADLNNFSQTVGPKEGGAVTPGTIFRGETPGDLTGPYISQFLLKPIPFGNTTIEQRYPAPAPRDDFMTDAYSWLEIQRGAAPTPLFKAGDRYISDARALGEYVHTDFSYQAYLSAALILLGMPGSLGDGNPYLDNPTQGGFVSLGGPDVLDLVAKAGNLSLTGAWYQKWLVHRRARPEVYGGRLHFQLTGDRDYDLPDEIADSVAVRRTLRRFDTAFLPMAFPEGSPTHPSYPAGHATIAGACCTVLKAFFEESALVQDPVETDASGQVLYPYAGELTIGGEINKLANNVSLGRDWAGVHYRSDGVDGLLVGEQQAIGMLRDYSLTYNERFDGFKLTTYEGEAITIRNGRVIRPAV